MSPESAAKSIFDHASGALMAHSIRGVESHFLKNGVYLQVLVLNGPPVMFRKRPLRSSLLTMSLKPEDFPDDRIRVVAKIYLRKGINHHLSRLAIAHELYHLLLALQAHIKSNRASWDERCRSEHEVACNKFAQEICRLHNEFNGDEELRKKRIAFPEEIFALDFILDLADFDKLPQCLKAPDSQVGGL